MQIILFHLKNAKTYCHCTNTSQNFNSYMNLMLKTENQEMHHLNYHNALWDCPGFTLPKSAICCRIRQMLPDLAISPD